MARLVLNLLGTYQVSCDGQTVSRFEADTARGLLFYLALQAGTFFSRGALAGLFWPEEPESTALQALRQALNRVRTALGERETSHPFLEVTRDAIRFNAKSDYQLDVAEFEGILEGVKRHPHRRLEVCRGCLRQMERAAGLYRGELLAGFYLNAPAFEDWLVLTRERLQRQAMDLFEQLAGYYEGRGEWEPALIYARRQVEIEPWCEEAHRQLMRLLAVGGKRSAALAQYQQCRQLLARELGVEPMEETRELYARIAQGEKSDRSIPVPESDLAVTWTPLVGREAELAALADRLNHPDSRWLTLVGPGGIGKSRLALQAAVAEMGGFRDGIVWIALAGLTNADLLPIQLAQALHWTFRQGESPWQQLSAGLRGKEYLLVIDNFESLREAAPQVAALLAGAPQSRVLATSRERLNVPGEELFFVEGLSCPPEGAEPGEDWSAARLFMQSARRIRPGFGVSEAEWPAVVELCRLVEGHPLALELAASWSTVFSCGEMVQEIRRDLGFLAAAGGDWREDHRNLRAVFDSSWALLSADERTLLCRLAVFRGQFDRAAIQAVTGALPIQLAGWVDRSWLRASLLREGGGEWRYEWHELLQRYVTARLGEDAQLEAESRRRHGEYYLDLLAVYTSELETGLAQKSLVALEREFLNVREAWAWALTEREDARIRPLVRRWVLFCDLRGWFQEGEDLFARAAAVDWSESTPSTLTAGLTAARAWFQLRLGRPREARELLDGALEQAGRGISEARAFALLALGAAALVLGDYGLAQSASQESRLLYEALADAYGSATVWMQLGQVAYAMADYAETIRCVRAGLELAQESGFQQIEADGLRQLGNTGYILGHYGEAREHYDQALICYRRLGHRWGEAATLSNLGAISIRIGDRTSARRYLDESIRLKQAIGDRRGMANTLGTLGVLTVESGEYLEARTYYTSALEIHRETGARQFEGFTLNNLGNVALYLGQYVEARNYFEAALQIKREIGERSGQSRTLGNLGLLAHYLGDNETAEACARESLALAQELGELSSQGFALTKLGHALGGLGRWTAAREVYQQAIELRRAGEELHLAMESLGGVARAELALGNSADALAAVEEIMAYLELHSLDGADEPFRVYWTCIQVLQAAGDARAAGLWQSARAQLRARAEKITDAALRKSFLSEVVVHAALMQEV